jgi:hypothetical protein
MTLAPIGAPCAMPYAARRWPEPRGWLSRCQDGCPRRSGRDTRGVAGAAPARVEVEAAVLAVPRDAEGRRRTW